LHYTYLAMESLLLAVFGFFGVHTFLWFWRSWIDRLRHGIPARLAAGQQAFIRFDSFHRTMHLLIIVSFLGLSLTGLPLKYSYRPWAQWLAAALGGFESTSFWHRICALVTIGYFATHLLWLARQVYGCRAAQMSWRAILFGPDSPVPTWRDFRDILAMTRWFVGLGPKPSFDRWSYWEKFDYWSVFWGVAIIGTSGLMLWFPEAFCRFLPGAAINIAKIIHSEEALLATGFIFSIHFFNTHLRAEKFPIDMSMLSGYVSEEELREERPEFVTRMSAAGKLDQLRSTIPSGRVLWAITLGGFVALLVGLALLVGIVASLLSGR
jgi:thiosulfate reductase cytochrome b subunit